MGTNGVGCTEWERDYDPVTEQPTEVETLRDELAAVTQKLERCEAILKAAGLDGARGASLLPVKQDGGRAW
jgi:hypothetical protein